MQGVINVFGNNARRIIVSVRRGVRYTVEVDDGGVSARASAKTLTQALREALEVYGLRRHDEWAFRNTEQLLREGDALVHMCSVDADLLAAWRELGGDVMEGRVNNSS